MNILNYTTLAQRKNGTKRGRKKDMERKFASCLVI